MNIAFAGFRHSHIYVLYNMALQNSETEIIGSFEEDIESRIAAEKNCGANFIYSTYDELLSDSRVDIVAIGNYYGARGGMIIKALRAGKHVITDKPLCTSLEELEQIEELISKTGLKVHCMFTMRYEKRVNAVKSLIQSGRLGKINNIYFGGQHPLQYGKRPMWYFEESKHGGVINDIGIHGIDMVRYICGATPAEILAARCWNAYAVEEPQFLDCAQFMLKLSNGAGLIADVSYSAPDSQGFKTPLYWEFNIWGTKGVLKFSQNSEITAYFNGDDKGEYIPDIEIKNDELEDFIREIKGDRDILLDTKDVISSTRDTLAIQKKSEVSL